VLLEPGGDHVEVTAVPGAGKTHLLMNTLGKLIIRGVDPAEILVLGFANETVRVLNDRRQRLLKTKTRELGASARTNVMAVDIRTMHSIGAKILHSGQASFLLGGQDLQASLVERSLLAIAERVRSRKYMPNFPEKARQARLEAIEALLTAPVLRSSVVDLLNRQRASGREISESIAADSPLSEHRRWLWRLAEVYAELMNKGKSLDFPALLERCTEWLARTKTNFRCVLVDEYQDCSPAQVQLIGALAKNGARIAVFGDPCQAIYGFNGAHYTRLTDVFQRVQTLRMNVSRRLTHQVAALLNALMGHEGDAQIVGSRSGAVPTLVFSDSFTEECERVASHIAGLIATGVQADQIAVLARTNLQLNDVEAALLRHGMGSARRGLVSEHPHVERVLSLVKLIKRRASTKSTVTAVDVESCWQADPPQLAQIQRGLPVLRRCLKKALDEANPAAPQPIGSLYQLCADAYVNITSAEGSTRKVQRAWRTEVNTEITQFAPLAAQHKSAAAMVAALRATSANSITTSTINSAKGREWQHVLIVGVTEGYLPIYHVKDGDEQGIEEERRLFYVAASRPMETLTLFHCPRPHGRTRATFDKLSRFAQSPAVQEHLELQESTRAL
jgi:DNA helicase-2/ATP-dependent DNA helicase PcrA